MAKLNPRVDVVFKKLFGVEENKDLLVSLINSIVSQEDQIEGVTLLNPYNLKNFLNDKLSILDIKAKGLNGQYYNIEVQISDESDYDKRALYYWAKLYTEQLKESSDYEVLKKTIGIHILNFTSIPEVEQYHNTFIVTEKDMGIPYFKDFELHTIELKKFTSNPKENLTDIAAKVKSSLDRWAAFLSRHDLLEKESLPKELEDKNLKKAIGVLEHMRFGDLERQHYEDHLKWLRIESSALKKHGEKKLEEGIGIGEERQKQKALEEKKEIARSLLDRGLSRQEISEITGLKEGEF
ncbi:MAG TPA: Rpn family recombination-promoting nuclease/putative transposase [Alphaproteobacteria bacterium]|nr:Rpn family recombination-promoting nuclease/putative transposase [Alphaproteobacteria bacterium]